MKKLLPPLLAACLALLCACTQMLPMPAEAASEGLTVRFLDVGQADSALLECGGDFMLIDGGNVDDSSYVVSALARCGVRTLRYVFNSHCDEDHCGGLAGVLAKYPAERVFSSTASYDSRAFSDFVKYAGQQGRRIEIPAPGDTLTFGDARITILAPLRDYGNNNDNSIVLRVDYGQTSFLFTGDAGLAPEDELVESGAGLSATVLKVGHHGSRHSTGYVFLREVMPQYAVISVGTGNDYGHPTGEAMSRLRDAGTTLFRTDLQGTVTAVSDGKTVTFTTERQADPLSVNPTLKDAPTCYIGNQNTGVFHSDRCESLPGEKNRVSFDTYWDALDAGYTPHKSCLP